jgi:hypothetical protein
MQSVTSSGALSISRRTAPQWHDDSITAHLPFHIELIDSNDERVAVVASNSVLDRAFGKPGLVKEEKNDVESRIKNITREERLAEMQRLLEPMRHYLRAAPK